MQIKLATAIAFLPYFVSAAPTATNNGIRIPLTKRSAIVNDGIIDLKALQNHRSHTQAKIAQGFAAYEANTGLAHPNYKASAVQRRQTSGSAETASLPLTDDSDELWEGEISVGTPPVKFRIDFDSGSSDLFLPGQNCGSSCSGHTKYDTRKSGTAVDTRRKFQLSFGDGSTVTGEIFTDTVSIQGLTATNQSIGAATQYNSGFASSRFPPDGLMGMAFQQISQYNAPPVFQTLVKDNQVSQPIFGFTLGSSGSELFLGGEDPKFSSKITYTPVTTVGFWQITFDGISVGTTNNSSTNSRRKSSKPTKASSIDAVVDTGTTLVFGDTVNVKKFYDAIPGSKDASQTAGEGFFTIPCSSVPDSITISIKGQSFPISKDTFSLGPVENGSSDCLGGVVADDSNEFWILGDVFLRNVYTSFDVGQTRVGFAPLA